MKKFEDLSLKSSTRKFLSLNGFVKPTPIQEGVIPSAVKGKDIIGLSNTGTGKSHAFLIPLMELVDPSVNQTQAVISAPTRELALQLYEKARVMMEADSRIKVKLYIGGKDREKDLRQLQSLQPHIAIGTPGRIKDLFLEEGALRIENAKVLVIDEADMTLEYGFLNDVDAFAGRMHEGLQMMCFSATMPDQLKPFVKKYMHQPVTVQVGDDNTYNPSIRHVLIPCYHHTYGEVIRSILPGFQPYVCLIFANTRQMAHEIAEDLRNEGIALTELHGDMESRKRKQAMKEIANATNSFIVASDLAARGIDLPTITHVISCGFPKELSYYIHRAGRSGRNGSKGTCYALYTEKDDASIRSLMKMGVHFEHARFHKGEWVTLRPYGIKRPAGDEETKKEIAKVMTKKKTKVKPGYKKKRAAEIDEIHRKKKRDFIRSKIKEEKTARYKEQSRLKKQTGE